YWPQNHGLAPVAKICRRSAALIGCAARDILDSSASNGDGRNAHIRSSRNRSSSIVNLPLTTLKQQKTMGIKNFGNKRGRAARRAQSYSTAGDWDSRAMPAMARTSSSGSAGFEM